MTLVASKAKGRGFDPLLLHQNSPVNSITCAIGSVVVLEVLLLPRTARRGRTPYGSDP